MTEKATVRDVVCGMEIQPAEAAAVTKFGWKTYHFCSEGCFKKFKSNPAGFAERDLSERCGELSDQEEKNCCCATSSKKIADGSCAT